jgi:chemotaxis signal transduction protein
MDLATLFGGLESGTSADAFAVVVFWRDVVAALLADSVDDVHDLRPEQIHPPLTSFSQARERYISGLTDSGLAIVDVEKLLSDEWLWVKQETQEETR